MILSSRIQRSPVTVKADDDAVEQHVDIITDFLRVASTVDTLKNTQEVHSTPAAAATITCSSSSSFDSFASTLSHDCHDIPCTEHDEFTARVATCGACGRPEASLPTASRDIEVLELTIEREILKDKVDVRSTVI